MTFTVLDTHTGDAPNLEEIAIHESWAKPLVYCDMEGFALMEDGSLILLDECGNWVHCPKGRFRVEMET